VDGNAAALQALDTRVTSNEDEIIAQASDITTLTTSVGNNTSAIQTKAEVTAVQDLESDVAVLSAQYAVKLDVNGYVSGVALANNGTTSEFIVASDAVYFIDPGQSIEAFNPGTNYSSIDDVRDTQLVFGYAEVEGFKRFVLNVPAYIPEGYITSGQVGEIGFGKITDSQGNPVTTVGGLLKADYIDVDNLNVASAATFYGDAQSGNFETGSIGWKLWQNGRFEIGAGGEISREVEVDGENMGSLVDSSSRVSAWTRPGSTLINGNKISTADVYVDTLQIKGEAVTVAQGGRRSSGLSIGSSWKNVVSFTYNHGESEAIGGIIGGYLNARSTTQFSSAVVELRVVYSGTPIESAVIIAGESYSQNAAIITYTSLFPGTRAVTLQARTIYTDTTANVNGALTITGAKR